MGRKKKKRSFSFSVTEHVKEETLHGIIAILCFAMMVFLLLAAWDKAGVVGEYTHRFLDFLLGVGYFLIPIVFLGIGISFFTSIDRRLGWSQVIASIIFTISGLGIIDILLPERGGILGGLISTPLLKFFEFTFALILMTALVIISGLVMFDVPFKMETFTRIKEFFAGRKNDEEDFLLGDDEEIDETVINLEEEEYEDEPEPEPREKKGIFGGNKKEESSDELAVGALSFNINKEYVPPPLSILQKDSGKPSTGDIKANANIIKRTMQNFGIAVEMDEVSIGPSVTRYALKPAEGVKLSKILGLQNNLELALAAHPVRIEAPIPGKSLVGIEIPNTAKTIVGLGSLLASNEFQSSKKPLLFVLGKDIAGNSHFANLAKMPHMLIAGATGSGKSVTIHNIVASLIYRNSPENMKFIMVDPKRVELTLYDGIPHLLTPVITDAKKAILSLKWAGKEMQRRYEILQKHRVQNIETYHSKILAPALKKHKKDKNADPSELPDTMPYIVIIIDELATIMQAYPRELEAAIVHLAQLSRAVGIHLILSTQRPDANVVTGLIKANIPARIALKVTSQVNSRVILDATGAENLLGQGDMLFMSDEVPKPRRMQNAFVSEDETNEIVDYLQREYEDELPDDLDLDGQEKENALFAGSIGDDADEDDDPLYEDARELVVEAGKASTSYIQRKLRVGYARAARLMDILEERGVIGEAEGSKPREVLIGHDEQSTDASDDVLEDEL